MSWQQRHRNLAVTNFLKERSHKHIVFQDGRVCLVEAKWSYTSRTINCYLIANRIFTVLKYSVPFVIEFVSVLFLLWWSPIIQFGPLNGLHGVEADPADRRRQRRHGVEPRRPGVVWSGWAGTSVARRNSRSSSSSPSDCCASRD